MIKIIKELDVEVTKPNIFQAIVAKQYDMNTRFLKVTFKDCGTRIDIPKIETAKVVINAERKDGQSKGFDGEINEDGTVTVPLHSWMLELDGTVICDISVIDTAADDEKKLTTTSFTLLVEKAAYGGNDITSDPQYDVLVQLLGTCNEASEVAQEALEKSNEANEKYYACVEATDNANQAAENANAVREEVEAGGFIESLKEMNKGGKFSFWVGTSEEYAALPEKIADCFYIITDDESKETLDALKTQCIVESGFATSTDSVPRAYYEKHNNGIIKIYAQVKCALIDTGRTAVGTLTFNDYGMLDGTLINCTTSINTNYADNSSHLPLTAEYVYRPDTSPQWVQAVVYRTDNAELQTDKTYIADLAIVGKWKEEA